MLKSYKYRIMPSEKQCQIIEHHIGCCRLVWNLALAAKKQAWESNRVSLSRYDLQEQLIDLKLSNEWLYDVNAQSLQNVLLNLDKAYREFFNGRGFPKFKKKHRSQSFQCPGNVRRVDWVAGTLTIPKISNIPIVLSREFKGAIKTITISRAASGKYFASILVDTVDMPVKPSLIIPSNTVGVDLGIKSFVVTSNGRKFEANRKLKNSLKRLQCLQRRASRKKKGSNNRKKANKCVAILHEKITNQRADYINKVTYELTHDSQVGSIVIEDLNVAGMLKNRNLSKAILDVSFGEFYRQLAYKCDWYGINLIKIGMFDPSSKRCSDCGGINKELTLGDREWTCQCGSTHDRDFNAAKNIKWFGLNNSRRGTPDEPVESRRLRRAKKQESKNQITNLINRINNA
jgi:putative transposase